MTSDDAPLPAAAVKAARSYAIPDRTAAGRITQLEHEWDALADATRASPFLRPGWFAAWWRSWGDRGLELVELRQEGRLVGLAPLRRRNRTLSSITNWHTPEFRFLADGDEAMDELLRQVYARGQDRVYIDFIPGDDPHAERIRAAALAAGYRLRTRVLERSPHIDIEMDWESYRRGLRRRFLTELKRRRRRLEELGELTVEVVRGGDELGRRLDEGLAVEGSGWKGELGTAIASSPVTVRFYHDIACWSAPRGWLRLAFLRLDDRVLAFKFSLEAEGVQYLLKGGYDPAFRAYSPGQVLQERVLEECFTSGLKRYDFLGHEELFKRDWTATAQDRLRIRGYAPTIGGRLDWAARAGLGPVIRRLEGLARSR